MLVHTGKYGTEIKNTDTTETKHSPEKANNTKHSKTKLAWFSRLLRHLTRKRGGLILQCSRTHTGLNRSQAVSTWQGCRLVVALQTFVAYESKKRFLWRHKDSVDHLKPLVDVVKTSRVRHVVDKQNSLHNNFTAYHFSSQPLSWGEQGLMSHSTHYASHSSWYSIGNRTCFSAWIGLSSAVAMTIFLLFKPIKHNFIGQYMPKCFTHAQVQKLYVCLTM